MKKTSIYKNLVWLRICMVTFGLAIISLFLFSFTVTTKLADDVWGKLGLSEKQGTEKIKNSFLNNYLDYYGVRNIKNIATGNRSAIAKDLLEYAKQYVNSPAFKSAYDQLRTESKPEKTETKVLSKEEVRKNMIDQLEKGIKDMEASMKNFNDDMKKALQPAIEQQKQMIKDYKEPENEIIEIMYQQQFYAQKGNEDKYAEDMKQWEENYPADYRQMVKSRLNKYLTLAKTVDFNAALTDKYGHKVFVNPVYEGKSSDWKMIYRAGKEVYDVAKPFSEKWISEL